MNAEVPAEMEFITSAVQPEPDVDRMRALVARNLDWERVTQEAVERHTVGSLLYRNLVESGSEELVPDQFLGHLREHSRNTATRNLSMTNSLLSILERLDEGEIPALPYKGPVLSEAVYADFSLRRSRDLDILVKPEDVRDAEAILREHGFRPKLELTEKRKQLLIRNGRQRTMKKGGLLVELHPRISSPDPPFETTELLERAGRLDLSGDPVPAIKPVDNLLVLSDHGTRHRWNQLKWICDIGYLIRNETLDWSEVLEESKRRGCYRRVLLGCGLASAVLDVDLPEIVRSGSNNETRSLLESTYPNCLGGTDETRPLRYTLQARDDASSRIRYCLGRLSSPPAGSPDDPLIPNRFVELYYIIYPVRVVTKTLIGTIRALLSEIRSVVKSVTHD